MDVTRHSWSMEQWRLVVPFDDKGARSCCSREPKRVMESYSPDVAVSIGSNSAPTSLETPAPACVRAWSRAMCTAHHLPRPFVRAVSSTLHCIASRRSSNVRYGRERPHYTKLASTTMQCKRSTASAGTITGEAQLMIDRANSVRISRVRGPKPKPKMLATQRLCT